MTLSILILLIIVALILAIPDGRKKQPQEGIREDYSYFFYSEKQDAIGWPFEEKNDTFVNGKKYSEWKHERHGNKSNWDDAVLVHEGYDKDCEITFGESRPFRLYI